MTDILTITDRAADRITKIITEKGIVKANKEEIKKLFDNVSD